MTKLNVLFITDDFDDLLLDILRSNIDNKMNLSKIREFKFIKNMDYVLVDYGLISNDEKQAIKVLRQYYNNDIKLIWCGGLHGRYNEDAKKLFPRLKFLHNLPECSLDDFYYTITRIEEGIDKY